MNERFYCGLGEVVNGDSNRNAKLGKPADLRNTVGAGCEDRDILGQGGAEGGIVE